jgi:hypothetical protein
MAMMLMVLRVVNRCCLMHGRIDRRPTSLNGKNLWYVLYKNLFTFSSSPLWALLVLVCVSFLYIKLTIQHSFFLLLPPPPSFVCSLSQRSSSKIRKLNSRLDVPQRLVVAIECRDQRQRRNSKKMGSRNLDELAACKSPCFSRCLHHSARKHPITLQRIRHHGVLFERSWLSGLYKCHGTREDDRLDTTSLLMFHTTMTRSTICSCT